MELLGVGGGRWVGESPSQQAMWWAQTTHKKLICGLVDFVCYRGACEMSPMEIYWDQIISPCAYYAWGNLVGLYNVSQILEPWARWQYHACKEAFRLCMFKDTVICKCNKRWKLCHLANLEHANETTWANEKFLS